MTLNGYIRNVAVTSAVLDFKRRTSQGNDDLTGCDLVEMLFVSCNDFGQFTFLDF